MTKSHLPRPIREVIDVPLDERETAARWRAIEQRTSAGSPSPRVRTVWAGGAAVALAAAIALAVLSSGPRAPGPVALRSGAPLGTAFAAETETRAVALDDGSTIRLAAGARMRVLDNSGRRLITLLEGGTARYEVQPGTGRAWVVEAGLATVEVTGTVFEVIRDERSVTVRVEQGRVLVRGEGVPDRVRALTAGESVVVRAPGGEATEPSEARAERVEESAPTAASPGETEVAEALEAPIAEAALPESGDPAAPAAPEATLAAAPSTPTATPAAGRAPRTRARGADRDLLVEADQARRAGRLDEALALLETASRERGPDGALASLTRGRLLLQSGRTREAIADLERARERASELPRSTQEVVTALLARAYQRVGDDARARALAAEYQARFPSGRLLDGTELETR